jgi:hypothetical protein
MSNPRPIIISAALCLLLMAVPACKRSAVEEPNPFGPASLFVDFELFVNPDVILTSQVRETAEVRALVKKGGEPAANELVVFTIIRGPGEFEDYRIRTSATTNSNGYAFINYLSPTKYQMSGDETVIIQAQLQTCSPYFRWKTVEIYLLQGQ